MIRAALSKLVRGTLVGLIRLYQGIVSPWIPASCRFHPTCSVYAAEAIRVHGAWRGTKLIANRLYRCRPGFPGGDDPVPERQTEGRASGPGAP